MNLPLCSEPQAALTLFVVACASVTDVWKGMIYNWLTLPALVLGVGLAAIHQGWTGFGLSILGVCVGGGVSLIPFVYGLLGGGDVKLLAALGAIMGPVFIGETLLIATLAGGIVGLGLMFARGKIVPTLVWYWGCLHGMFRFLFYKGTALMLPDCPKAGTAPFAVCIAIGALVAYYYDVLSWFIAV